jgi:uncharacterized protein (DUF433 family)
LLERGWAIDMKRILDPTPYVGRDPREIPAYRFAEAAHYLQMPKATLRAWALGQGSFRPVLRLPEPLTPSGPRLLCFMNLVELHVLEALRREHRVPLPQVRKALRFLGHEFPDYLRPLAEIDLLTDGLDVFVEHYADLINASKDGQRALREVLEKHLLRVERDETGLAARLFPFTRKRDLDSPKSVVIDPAVGFGRPTLIGTGIPTSVLAERWKAGESMDELAEEYRRTPQDIQEALRWEFPSGVAA